MKRDIENHVTGISKFVDDFPTLEGTLEAYLFYSEKAHARILNIDFASAFKSEGVVAVFTADDIPGDNQIGGIIKDEKLFAEDEVEFIGEPIALVIADTKENAKRASEKILVEYEDLPAVTDPREAYAKGSLIKAPQIFSGGDVDSAWKECDVIVEGKVDSGGQEHLYLETQASYAVPTDSGLKIYSSTQSPTVVQRTTSNVLNIPMNRIEVDVLRLGGAFGGKEDQATVWAVLSALAAYKINRPVKLILSRMDDLKITGKRHPYSSDYKIGLSRDGKIIAYEVTFYQNAGAFADLSTAILERTLFHAANCYAIPNVKATGISCKTNLPPNTAFRGFGGPQGMFVIESALHKAADVMGIDVDTLQRKNLIVDNDVYFYGQKAENAQAVISWQTADEKFNLDKLKQEVKKFNEQNERYKKGFAVMPISFGISFTNSFLNQASALVHVYTDGSVGVSTAAVEMGQGVNEKIIEVCSRTFSISKNRIKIETTNTTRIANTSPTAASTGADLNGNAAKIACDNILERLKIIAAQKLNAKDSEKISIENEQVYLDGRETDLGWDDLIQEAYFSRTNLSSHAYYATPDIYFDRDKNIGSPFAYNVYGTSFITVTVDCLLGIYKFDSVKIVHDFGRSLHPLIDLGQAEGALAQGIGWMTMEELVQSKEGELKSNTLSTYKVPDIYSIPEDVTIEFLENSENRFGPFNSKAIGEPPFMYGIGVYFAILNAMRAFNPDLELFYNAPITPEKVLLALYPEVRYKHET
ncbi:Xanthine dehydrogenase, molybdenum binding subunit [hydrothermal vent metagenome]|uniref:Xanthine dehydrogenase, molybdenum binding subunit n=1 Tax=hydrothermal vent metagenome TaxID=652676 RepID=A0A3B1BTH9_9ZZZZ